MESIEQKQKIHQILFLSENLVYSNAKCFQDYFSISFNKIRSLELC